MKNIQALHAGISRRDWHAVEIAANAIRDADYALIRDLVTVLRDIRETYQPVTHPMRRIINEALVRVKAAGYEP